MTKKNSRLNYTGDDIIHIYTIQNLGEKVYQTSISGDDTHYEAAMQWMANHKDSEEAFDNAVSGYVFEWVSMKTLRPIEFFSCDINGEYIF